MRTANTAKPAKIKRIARWEEQIWGYAFIFPNLLSTVVFLFIPLIYSIYISFMQWDMIRPPKYIGLANYSVKLMQDTQFFLALKNTVIFSAISIPLGIALAILVAYLLSGHLHGNTVFRSIVFLPVIMSTVAVSMIWKWLLNGDYGVVNYLLSLVGINGVHWLGDAKYAMGTIIAISIWKNLGFNVVILIAAFKDVPSRYFESAALDGANEWQKLTLISLPLIAPSVFFVTIMSVINSFQVFDLIYNLTMGGPNGATTVLYYLVYQNAFKFFDMGYASALSWIVFAIIFVFTILQMRMKRDQAA